MTEQVGHAERVGQAEQPAEDLPARPGWAPIVALVVVLVVFTAYTVEAFRLEWVTARGNIGPGRFPRVIGVAGIAATALALVQVSIRRRRAAPAGGGPAGEGRAARRRRAAVVAVTSSVLLVALLEVLGALLAGFLFLLVNLHVLDPGRRALNLAVAGGFVVVAYGLMSLLLDAPWAVGLLGF